jgi:hypothetical protein
MLLEKKRVSKRKMAFFAVACRFFTREWVVVFPLKIRKTPAEHHAAVDSFAAGDGFAGEHRVQETERSGIDESLAGRHRRRRIDEQIQIAMAVRPMSPPSIRAMMRRCAA